mmetsp:Transcript_14241/g.33704  ORF Transcript_14241/g.33704 Transcript_14241/m.33704 type:complete len:509 (-) Transcript_14241:1084-2610(-)
MYSKKRFLVGLEAFWMLSSSSGPGLSPSDPIPWRCAPPVFQGAGSSKKRETSRETPSMKRRGRRLLPRLLPPSVTAVASEVTLTASSTESAAEAELCFRCSRRSGVTGRGEGSAAAAAAALGVVGVLGLLGEEKGTSAEKKRRNIEALIPDIGVLHLELGCAGVCGELVATVSSTCSGPTPASDSCFFRIPVTVACSRCRLRLGSTRKLVSVESDSRTDFFPAFGLRASGTEKLSDSRAESSLARCEARRLLFLPMVKKIFFTREGPFPLGSLLWPPVPARSALLGAAVRLCAESTRMFATGLSRSLEKEGLGMEAWRAGSSRDDLDLPTCRCCPGLPFFAVGESRSPAGEAGASPRARRSSPRPADSCLRAISLKDDRDMNHLAWFPISPRAARRFFVTNGCRSRSSMLGRSDGSFLRAREMKPRASALRCSGKDGLPHTMSMAVCFWLETSKGGRPTRSSYVITPTAQTSTFRVYGGTGLACSPSAASAAGRKLLSSLWRIISGAM